MMILRQALGCLLKFLWVMSAALLVLGSFFWYILIGQGWKTSEGIINYQYVGGWVPPTQTGGCMGVGGCNGVSGGDGSGDDAGGDAGGGGGDDLPVYARVKGFLSRSDEWSGSDRDEMIVCLSSASSSSSSSSSASTSTSTSTSTSPPQWHTNSIVRNTSALLASKAEASSSNSSPPSIAFSYSDQQELDLSGSLFLYWNIDESAWVVSGDAAPNMFMLPTTTTKDIYPPVDVNASSVPSSSGWKRVIRKESDSKSGGFSDIRALSSDSFWEYYNVNNCDSFSIEFFGFDRNTNTNTNTNSSDADAELAFASSSKRIPECYDYVLTQYPVEQTYWPGLAMLFVGASMLCFARRFERRESATQLSDVPNPTPIEVTSLW